MEDSNSIYQFLQIVGTVLTLVGMWKIFVKMSYDGWKGIIPFYNLYIIYEELYGKGWKMLLLFIPIYGIYVRIKQGIDMAAAFGKSVGFGVGLALLPAIFNVILGFDSSVYKQ